VPGRTAPPGKMGKEHGSRTTNTSQVGMADIDADAEYGMVQKEERKDMHYQIVWLGSSNAALQ
jgi:hypothetical protein